MKLRQYMADLWKMLQKPPVGFQHGRRGTSFAKFPVVHWFYYHFEAHFTTRIILFSIIGVAPVLYILMIGFRGEICAVGFALIAWIIVSMLVGYFSIPKLKIDAVAPKRVECGAMFETVYKVQNTGRKTARYVEIDTLIYPDVRCLVRDSAWIGCLPPGHKTEVSAKGLAKRRGVYTLPGLRYDSAFPCGLWRWGWTFPGTTLSIYPSYSRLLNLFIPLGNGNQNEISAENKLSREALEFHGCREYREGDQVRHIHPRSSARIGTPVVKEFQSEGRRRTAILVDTEPSEKKLWKYFAYIKADDPIEAALSLTAAVVDYLSVSDRVLELLVAGPQIYRFVSTGRIGYLEDVLDILAAVEPCEAPFSEIESMLYEEIRDIQSVCLILVKWDKRRRNIVRELESYGVGVKVILITSSGERPESYPVEQVCLSAKEVMKGEVCSL